MLPMEVQSWKYYQISKTMPSLWHRPCALCKLKINSESHWKSVREWSHTNPHWETLTSREETVLSILGIYLLFLYNKTPIIMVMFRFIQEWICTFFPGNSYFTRKNLFVLFCVEGIKIFYFKFMWKCGSVTFEGMRISVLSFVSN